jgi:hypothetical protein
MKTAAEFADVFDGEAALLAQRLGDNAGSTKDVEQVFLPEFVGLDQPAHDSTGRAGVSACLVFEVFDENGQQSPFAIQGLEHGDAALVLLFAVDDGGQSPSQQGSVFRLGSDRAHGFHFPDRVRHGAARGERKLGGSDN